MLEASPATGQCYFLVDLVVYLYHFLLLSTSPRAGLEIVVPFGSSDASEIQITDRLSLISFSIHSTYLVF